MEYLIIYICLVSIIGIILVIADKKRAKKGKYRVPEKTLVAFGVIGAALPMLIAMRICRHKTRKPKFYIGFPIIILIQIGLAVYLFLCKGKLF